MKLLLTLIFRSACLNCTFLLASSIVCGPFLKKPVESLTLNFAIDSEGAAVRDSHSTSSRTFKRLSTLKMELESQEQYANLMAEMVTFSTLTVQDSGDTYFLDSLKAELAGVQGRIKDSVY